MLIDTVFNADAPAILVRIGDDLYRRPTSAEQERHLPLCSAAGPGGGAGGGAGGGVRVVGAEGYDVKQRQGQPCTVCWDAESDTVSPALSHSLRGTLSQNP